MLGRLRRVLELRATFSRVSKDYDQLSRRVNTDALVGTAIAGTTKDRPRAGNLPFTDNTGNAKRGRGDGNGIQRFNTAGASQADDDDPEWRRRAAALEEVKAVRARVLFRQLPVALSRVERLLGQRRTRRNPENSGRKHKKMKANKSSEQIIANHPTSAASPAAVTNVDDDDFSFDEMMDLVVASASDGAEASMTVDNARGGNKVPALIDADKNDHHRPSLTEVDDQNDNAAHSAAAAAATSDNFLFGRDGLPSAPVDGSKRGLQLPSSSSMRDGVTVANVTVFLQSLAYFEGQRERFIQRNRAEYQRTRTQLRSDLEAVTRRLSRQYQQENARTVRAHRPETLADFTARDPDYQRVQQRLTELSTRQRMLESSLLARPYTSAVLWKAVLQMPMLPPAADTSPRPAADGHGPMETVLQDQLHGGGSAMSRCDSSSSGPLHSIPSRSGGIEGISGPRFATDPSLPNIVSAASSSSLVPALGRGCDITTTVSPQAVPTIPPAAVSIRIAYMDAVAAMVQTVLRAVSVRGTDHALNRSTPRFITSETTGAAGWLPSHSAEVPELVLLSYTKIVKVLEGTFGGPRAGLPVVSLSARQATKLLSALTKLQRSVSATMILHDEAMQAGRASTAFAELLAPMLASLEAAMTNATDVVVTSMVAGAGTSRDEALAHLQHPPEAARVLSRLHSLQAFDSFASTAALGLLYRLIQCVFPQAASRTNAVLLEKGERSAIHTFVRGRKRLAMAREGRRTMVDVMRDENEVQRLHTRRIGAALKASHLRRVNRTLAEELALALSTRDLASMFTCLAMASTSRSRSGGDSPVPAARFSPPKDALGWAEVLRFALPQCAEALFLRYTLDQAAHPTANAASAHAGAVDTLRTFTQYLALSVGSSLMDEALRGGHAKAPWSASTANAFVLFALDEVKAALGGLVALAVEASSGAAATTPAVEVPPALVVTLLSVLGQAHARCRGAGTATIRTGTLECGELLRALLIEDSPLRAAVVGTNTRASSPPTDVTSEGSDGELALVLQAFADLRLLDDDFGELLASTGAVQ